MTNFLTPLPPPSSIDLLFKNNRIRNHVTNFKTPSPPFRVDVINVWSPRVFIYCYYLTTPSLHSCIYIYIRNRFSENFTKCPSFMETLDVKMWQNSVLTYFNSVRFFSPLRLHLCSKLTLLLCKLLVSYQ